MSIFSGPPTALSARGGSAGGTVNNLEVTGKTIKLSPGTKIEVAEGQFITMKEIRMLLQFNKKLMAKCGRNLEYCMIKDNDIDEDDEDLIK